MNLPNPRTPLSADAPPRRTLAQRIPPDALGFFFPQ